MISLMLRVQAISGEDLVDIVAKPILDLRKYWDEARESYQAAINAASQLATNGEIATYTPEAKAELLHLFSKNVSRVPRQNGDDHRQLASAAFSVVNTVKTHREFTEILRRMGQAGGAKGSVVDLKNNYVSLVLRFLYQSPNKAQDTEQWLSTLYS